MNLRMSIPKELIKFLKDRNTLPPDGVLKETLKDIILVNKFKILRELKQEGW